MKHTSPVDSEYLTNTPRYLGNGATQIVTCYYLLIQGQYWIEYLYLLLAIPPYMAAANFVVITNGGGCALTGTADIDQ